MDKNGVGDVVGFSDRVWVGETDWVNVGSSDGIRIGASDWVGHPWLESGPS